MNGRVSKKIRREVYGELSLRERKRYRNPATGQILSDPLRSQYQKVKRLYKEKMRNGGLE